MTKPRTHIMRGNTNENWEIVSVFYWWEGHPILQIGPECGNTETRVQLSVLSSDLTDFSGLVVLHDPPVSWLTVCGRLRSLSTVPKPNWLWYWWLALHSQCLPVVLCCSLSQSEVSVDRWWPMRGRVCCVVIVIVSHGYNVARHNN